MSRVPFAPFAPFAKLAGAQVLVGAVLLATGCSSASVDSSESVEQGLRKSPPKVTFATPTYGATVTTEGPLLVSVNVQSWQGITEVALFDNGQPAGTLTALPYDFRLPLTAAQNGIHTLEARATDQLGRVGKSSLQITVNIACSGCEPPPPPPPPPPSSVAYGPQPDILCPAGAVDIWPGQDIPSVVDSRPPGTSFCVRAGTYSPTRPIYLRTGTTLTGEYGAIIDGANVTQSYDQGGITVVSGWNCGAGNCDAATVRNLVVRNQAKNCIGATGNAWRVDHVEVTGCGWGLNFIYDKDVLITGSSIHHNGYDYGSGPFGNNPGGGYGFYMTQNLVMDGNEIAYNKGNQKAGDSWNVTYRNNFAHHNTSTALWCDGCDGYHLFGSTPATGNGVIMEGNRVEDNAYEGLMVEISARGIVRNNVVKRNGGNSIFISTSHDADVYGNDLTDNWRGIQLFVYCDGITEVPERGYDLANNSIHDNTVRLTSAAPAGWINNDGSQRAVLASWSYTGCTSAQVAPYQTNAKNNRFEHNAYIVPNLNPYWGWVSWLSWEQWLSLPQDATSTRTIAP